MIYKVPVKNVFELSYDTRNTENREKVVIFALFRYYFHYSKIDLFKNLHTGTVFHALQHIRELWVDLSFKESYS